jgi:hypothetical protein
MGKVYRDGKAAVKRNRVMAGKITTPDPFSSPKAASGGVSSDFPK